MVKSNSDEVLGNHRRQSKESRLESGLVSALDWEEQTIWIADAHRDGKRFIVRADEMLTAFVELQKAIHEFAVSLTLVKLRKTVRRPDEKLTAFVEVESAIKTGSPLASSIG